MKKVLIFGCSHSSGSFNHNDPKNSDKTNGWPALIANNFLNYEVHCITHHGGGIINYLWSLGHFVNKFGKDYFDNIIIQISDEPRLTMYDIPLHTIEQFLSSNEIKDSFFECEKIDIKGTFYRYLSYGKLWDFCSGFTHDGKSKVSRLHNINSQTFLSLNLYLVFMTENFLSIIKTMFDNSKLFSFRWDEYPNLSYASLPEGKEKELGTFKYSQIMGKLKDITIPKWKKDFPFLLEKSAVQYIKDRVGEKQELLFQMSDSSTHYDNNGNKLVYKYLEPHLKEFLI